MAKKEPIDIGVYLVGWTFEDGDISDLRRRGRRIAPQDYQPNMKGKIFCWYCGTNITRRPLESNFCSDNTPAYFAHIPTYKGVECDRRTKPTPGFNFENEEDAQRAIERGDLVIVAGFAQDAQEVPAPAGPYAAGPVEDPDGPLSQVPIGRHVGDDFLVPGRQRTVAGICRRLDENLKKYYFLPGMRVPQLLSELLHNTAHVLGIDEVPKLYFGKIKSVTPHRFKTTVWLAHDRRIKDFALTGSLPEMQGKGFHAGSAGQYAMFWGPVIEHGIGYAVRGPAWGEYALVSPQYTQLLDELAAVP